MSQRTLNFNAMAAASQKQLMDMTPSAYLINSGDVGANILIPPGGRVGFVHVELDAGGTAGATVVADYSNDLTGPWVQAVWTSNPANGGALTGPNTADGFVPMTGAAFIRLRRTDASGLGNVSGTVAWS